MTGETPAGLAAVRVVGVGLIGTSIGLALRERGVDVLLADHAAEHVRLAADLGAGRPDDGSTVPLAVVAVPPAATARTVAALLGAGRQDVVTDTASIKGAVLEELETTGLDLSRFVGGHPMAGRERSGPTAGRADLFEGRPWVLTPTAATSAQAVDVVTGLVEACGAEPMRYRPDQHDAAVALVSHLPQLVASALAAQLEDAPATSLRLAGSGLRDMLRTADSPAELWSEIVSANQLEVQLALSRLRELLGTLGDEIAAGNAAAAVHELVAAGGAGLHQLPGKHGRGEPVWGAVQVVVTDAPGELARLLADSAAAGANVEDIAIDHAPGRPVGVIELTVQSGQAERLAHDLAARGWSTSHTEAGQG